MNLLYRTSASINGSERRVVQHLKNEIGFDSIVVVEFEKGADKLDKLGFETIDGIMCYENSYEQYKGWKHFWELDENVLKRMIPYKDNCIHMLSVRPHNLYVGTYDELEMLYYKNIKFWYNILRKKQIDVIFLPVIPHFAWEYTLYSLAKCLEIPTMILMNTHIWGLSVPGTSIERIGENVTEYSRTFQSIRHTQAEPIIKDYLKKAATKHSRISDRDKIKSRQHFINGFHKKNVFYKPVKRIVKDIIFRRSTLRTDMHHLFDSLLTQARSCSLSYYNKFSQNNIEGPYVYYAMQVVPEANTLPWAGVFSNQLLSIRLLSRALSQFKIKLVVKEHWYQPYRPRFFYDELKNIPNVVCIKADVDSYKLIDKCIAVATQTGSCITEAILKGKPAITFTKSYWSGCPDVYLVKNQRDILQAVEKILSVKRDITALKKDADIYFNSLENTTIRHNLDYYGNELISEEERLEDILDLVKSFKEASFSEDFHYVRSK